MYLVAFAKVGSPASICCHQPVSIGLEFVGKSSGAKGKRSGFLFPARIQGFEDSAGHGASMYVYATAEGGLLAKTSTILFRAACLVESEDGEGSSLVSERC